MRDPSRRLATAALMWQCVAAGAAAQTLPSGVINAPPTVIGDFESIGSNTTLNLGAGGSVGWRFNAGLPDGSSTNAILNVQGGTVGVALTAHGGSVVNLESGNILPIFVAEANSAVVVSGGYLSTVHAKKDSEVSIRGGRFGGGLVAEAGSHFEFVGNDFNLNGLPYSGPVIELTENDFFTGTLSDGSPFLIRSDEAGRLGPVALRVTPLPEINLAPIVVDSPGSSMSNGLRPGQTLTVRDNGHIGSDYVAVGALLNFEGGWGGQGVVAIDSEVNLYDGFIYDGFEAFGESVVKVFGGTLRDDAHVYEGSKLTVDGGSIWSGLQAHRGSRVTLIDGVIGTGLQAQSNSLIDVRGGVIEGFFDAFEGSTINISGGTIESPFLLPTGCGVAEFCAGYGYGLSATGSSVNISGGEIEELTAEESDLQIRGGVVHDISVFGNSATEISGGTVHRIGGGGGATISISGGEIGQISIPYDDVLTLIGTDFAVDGVALDIDLGATITLEARRGNLSGLFADGSPFEFVLGSSLSGAYISDRATLALTLVPEPTSGGLVMLVTVLSVAGRDSKREWHRRS